MAEKILLTAIKGGTGVTTCAVGLAEALAGIGERVLLFDGDARACAAAAIAGVGGLAVYSLADAKNGACRVKQAIINSPVSPNCYVLPSLGCDDEKYREKALCEVEGLFDYVLCDKAAKGVCSKAYVVTDPYPISVKQAEICLNELRDGGMKSLGVIVNKVNGGLVFDGQIMTPQEISTLLRAPLIAVIPEDLTLPLGGMKKSSKRAFALGAGVMTGKSDKVQNVILPYVGISGMIKRKMRAKL